jgi:hypothetical protein
MGDIICLQELDESRRLYSSQKKALKEALNAAAEREANEVAADEANRTVIAQAVEDEMEQLHHQLAVTKVRVLFIFMSVIYLSSILRLISSLTFFPKSSSLTIDFQILT